MKRLFIGLLWVLVIAGACVAGDHFLRGSSRNSAIIGAAQTFYQDFRSRVISFVQKKDPPVDKVKEQWLPTLPPALLERVKAQIQKGEEPGGYVYIDKEGGLHLTTRLDEVPKEYRSAAKPLEK